jgi:flavorubredoxin
MSRIEPIKNDPSSYDLVIIACPLWANLMPPPIRTYIFDNKGKFRRVALMSVSGSGKGNDKTIPDFETAVGKEASAILMLSQTEMKRGGYKEKLQEFSESISKLSAS